MAKLIGFSVNNKFSEGTSNDDQDAAVIPIKWLAPETLESLDSSKILYNDKTDVWSYGVTLWEIYSKGDAPYAKYKSADMKKHLKTGTRLSRPDACPPDLFDKVVYPCWNATPKKRPSFQKICSEIETFRDGAQESGGYYAAGTDAGTDGSGGYYCANNNRDRESSDDNNLYHDAR
jgi:serine/threonine protein kinase